MSAFAARFGNAAMMALKNYKKIVMHDIRFGFGWASRGLSYAGTVAHPPPQIVQAALPKPGMPMIKIVTIDNLLRLGLLYWQG